MALKVEIKTNLREFQRGLRDFQRRQIPFATALALNELAAAAQSELHSQMEKVFDRPTPFTVNAFYVKKASKRDLTAFVGVRDFASKGTPAWKYLTPETIGGERNMKRFEKRLAGLSDNQFIVPGRGARLDQYGNISRGQIGQILSRLGAMPDVGQNVSDKTTARLRRKGLVTKASGGRSDYFVAKSKRTGRPRGVYQLVGRGKVVPVLLFREQAPEYSPRFDFEGIVIATINRRREAAFARALAQAMATARR